jgi:hypothetical protein
MAPLAETADAKQLLDVLVVVSMQADHRLHIDP